MHQERTLFAAPARRLPSYEPTHWKVRLMIKLNRIGNKLGFASAVGVLLAIGMVGNQMMAGTRVDEASDSANRSQQVADGTLTAHVNMRQMQLAGRAIRLAKSVAEVDKDLVEVHQFAAAEAKQLDAALASARRPETRSRLEKIKSLTESYSAGVDELAKAQTDLLKSMEKRTTISTEWEKAFEHLLASPALAEQADRKDAEILLYQADGKIKGMRAAVWRLSTTGEESQKKAIATYKTALDDSLARIRGLSDNKGFKDGVDALASIATRFAAANDETVKAEELKTEILAKRTVSVVNESGEQMASAVAYAQNNAKVSKEEVAATTARANTVNLAMAVVVVVTLVASGVFSFLGIARPMTRLNGALDKMAAGNLEIVVPGADRGDEIGDLAKTVTVIRENAEQKARDEVEAKARQDQVAAQQRKADMIRMADDFEGAVGEIVETVSSASTELEASAGTLTSTAERAQELATTVAAASEEASTNVQSVASATEEMASSVNEISRQVQEFGADGQRSRRSGAHHQRPGRRTVEGGGPHRRRRRTDQHHRRPDQSAGAERHHRGGARRRSRPRLCRGGLRGQGAGRADGKSDRRNRPADIRHPGGDAGVGERHQGNQRHHRKAVGDLLDHCSRGGRAGGCDPGDFPQRAAGRARHPAGLVQHRRRAARRQRDRLGLFAGTVGGKVAVGRLQPAQARSRQVLELGAGGLTISSPARNGAAALFLIMSGPAGCAIAHAHAAAVGDRYLVQARPCIAAVRRRCG